MSFMFFFLSMFDTTLFSSDEEKKDKKIAVNKRMKKHKHLLPCGKNFA